VLTQTPKSGNEPAKIAEEEDGETIGIANELDLDEQGWQVIPYGDHGHSNGIQRFGQPQAESIVKEFKKITQKIKRALVGLPVFNGHPDCKAFANVYKDGTEYGQVADMEVRPNGLAVRMVLGSMGEALVRSGRKFISPFWDVHQATADDGKSYFLPHRMKSIGLVATPNIPNPTSLLNAAQAENDMNKAKLIALLALANEATEEQIEAKITDLLKRPAPQDLANEKTERSKFEGQATSLANENTQLKTDLTASKEAFANERKARCDEAIAAAIRGGKIAEADKATWEGRLTRDFANESKALAALPKSIKTEGLTEGTAFEKAAADLKKAGELTEENEPIANAGSKIVDLVAAKREEFKKSGMAHAKAHDMAYQHVKKNHPKLFAAK